jgi:hypothetical protein
LNEPIDVVNVAVAGISKNLLGTVLGVRSASV